VLVNVFFYSYALWILSYSFICKKRLDKESAEKRRRDVAQMEFRLQARVASVVFILLMRFVFFCCFLLTLTTQTALPRARRRTCMQTRPK
jgi:hypothetical protein